MEPYHYKKKRQTDLYPKREIEAKLEFDKIRELVLAKCVSELGKERAARMKVTADADKIALLLEQVREFKELEMMEEQPFPTENYLPLHDEMKYLQTENAALGEEQVFKLLKVLQTIGRMLLYFGGKSDRNERYPQLFKLLEGVNVDKSLLNAIKDVIDENGKIRSTASKELASIRRGISDKFRQIERQFKALVNEYSKQGWLSDSVESIRNGRRVLSVPAEHKRKIKGMLHDQSSSGNTFFIEPEATLQANNDIFELQQAEKREIYRILRELTAKIRPYAEDIAGFQKLMGLFDFIRAKALFAWDTEAQKPRLSTDRSVEVFAARHPLLLLKNKALKKEVVPLDYRFSIAERILVVSGPNAGGKSVMLKTVGLLQMMLQAGMLVPVADHSIMTVFGNIYVDMGDEQSIENDLSTYSSHLRNMRYFTQNANAKTLLLIDEFGSGTDPAFGGAIAEAILESLVGTFCYGVITTHYSNLKVFAGNTTGVANGCMTFDHKTLSPKYKMETGKPGSSFAFELAQKSGLGKQLIDAAKNKVDADYKVFDELLTNLQRDKQAVNEKVRLSSQKEAKLNAMLREYQEKQAELEANRKKILLEAQEQAKAVLADANKRFENMVREWSENKGEKGVIKQIRREVAEDKSKLSKSIEKIKDVLYYRDAAKGEISEGDHVRLATGSEVGKVLEVRKNTAVVQFDLLKTHVKLKQLVAVEMKAPPKPEKSGYAIYNSLEARSNFDPNLDIRGMRRQEALQAVEDLLDKAVMFNADEIKIIHGIGNGVLRRSVRDLLRGYKSVASVSDEDPQYGGAGVSIVALA